MDGLQLAAAIRAIPLIASVRLVLVTPLGQRGEGDAARAAGIQGYLTKPVRQVQLHDCLVAVLGLKETERGQLITRHTLAEAKAQRQGRILLAEDNEVNQMVALGILKKLGCRADVVHNGREAVEAVERQPYDLVLMDCQMPELDGFAATARIRQHEQAQHHTPIIAMTANAMHGDRERCLAAGMDDYISKPITLEMLREKLAHWLPDKPETIATATGVLSPEDVAALPAPLDLQRVEALRDLLEEAFPRAMQAFLRDVPTRLEELREAITRQESTPVAHLAHTLKGSSENLGAMHLGELCRQLMDACQHGERVELAHHLVPIEVEFRRVHEVLAPLCSPIECDI
jgi:two-component system, sensor histidine kinase and response regulator